MDGGVLKGSLAVGLTMEEFDGLDELERQEALAKAERRYRECGAHFVIRDLRQLPHIIAKIEQ